MKTKILVVILLLTTILSCDDENDTVDTIYEFVSFRGNSSVNLNELTNSTTGYPLVVQLWAFKPYSSDIDLTLEITGTDAQKGVDFTVTPDATVKIRAGHLTSDTVWIKTINNDDTNELARQFEVKIKTVSSSDIKIGLGITEPEKGSVQFTIVDDECSGSPLCVFHASLTNLINDDVEKPATGTVNKTNSTLTVVGDLFDYSPFPNATVTITLTPDSPDSETGTATFNEQEAGTASDGYLYKFIQNGTGSYDAVAGTVTIEYEVWYMEGGAWVDWMPAKNIFQVP